MSKYAPLGSYLRESGQEEIAMTFREIEAVIGAPLPASAYRRREWWANNPNRHTHARAWLEAGYITSEVNMDGQRLQFLKTSV